MSKDIKKLIAEIAIKDKIINEMAEMLNNYDIDEDICRQMGNRIHCNEFADKEKCKACIIKYIEKKVEEERNEYEFNIQDKRKNKKT